MIKVRQSRAWQSLSLSLHRADAQMTATVLALAVISHGGDSLR